MLKTAFFGKFTDWIHMQAGVDLPAAADLGVKQGNKPLSPLHRPSLRKQRSLVYALLHRAADPHSICGNK